MHKIIKSDVYLKSHDKAFLWFDVDEKSGKSGINLSVTEKENRFICTEIYKNLCNFYKKFIL